MEKILHLEKGEIILGEETMYIRDHAKKEKLKKIASSAMWTVFGILSVARYMTTGDGFLLWTGSIIGVYYLAELINCLLRTTKAEVNLHESETANFKENNGNTLLSLRLKGGLKRRISKIEPVSEELKTFFAEKKIAVK